MIELDKILQEFRSEVVRTGGWPDENEAVEIQDIAQAQAKTRIEALIQDARIDELEQVKSSSCGQCIDNIDNHLKELSK